MQTNPWMTILAPKPTAAVRLFCFPYAGGGSLIYRGWERDLPTDVEVCAVELPGRGKRINERPFHHITPLVEAADAALHAHLNKPFAFFGHSMGAKIAFELSRLLRRRYGLSPQHLFVSGCRAPQIPSPLPITYNLPEAEFLHEVRELNGTPAEVLQHPELMQLMVPLLRADFEVVQTYAYAPGPPLSCPITAYGGEGDTHIPLEHVQAWSEQTTSAFSVSVLPGDHFFINSLRPRLLQLLSLGLQQVVRGLQ